MNTTSCRFDGGDYMGSYPLCATTNRSRLTNGFCNTGFGNYYVDDDYSSNEHTENLNTEECDWDGGGDCVIPDYPDCHTAHPLEFFGGYCDDEAFNNSDCSYDNGACLQYFCETQITG